MSSVVNAISSYIPGLSGYGARAQEEPATEIVISYKTIDIIVPDRPLAMGSLQIIQNSNTPIDQSEVYLANQKIIQVWEKQGITDYLRYGKVSNTAFNLEMIPFSKKSWGFFQQLKVLQNVTFGGIYISQNQRKAITEDFKKFDAPPIEDLSLEIDDVFLKTQLRLIEEAPLGNDAFCTPDIIKKQLVFEGKFINVLYDYAPIGLEKLHLLLIPKEHRKGFSDLTEEEYLEAADLSQKLIHFYKNKNCNPQGFAVHVFDKTGALAGQTVPHWHQHHVFTTTKVQGLWGKLTVLKNMIFGSSPLKSEELETRVEQVSKDLKDLHKKTN